MMAAAHEPQEDSTPGFESWLTNVSTFYKQLTDKERNLTLDFLISVSGENQFVHLYPLLEHLLYRDFLRLLPPELCEHLLAFLDPKSLLRSCCVNKTWNQIISSSAGAWQRACKTIGLVINKQFRSHDGQYWKSFFVEMALRQQQMREGRCFEGQVYDRQLRKVTAVHYHRGKLATASDNKRIQIFDCRTNECIMTLRTESSVSSVKFDDRILIASSYVGHMMCWCLATGQRLVEYLRHVGAIFSFDYSERLDIIVSGSADTKIKVWSLMKGNILATLQGHHVWVLKVMLRPLPVPKESDNQIDNLKHLLFSMDKTGIIVWAVCFGTARGVPEGLFITSLYNIPFKNSDMDVGFFTPGLHFDGTHLYFINQEPPMAHKPALLCKWNVDEKKMDAEICLNIKVKIFLGIGSKYLAFVTPHRHKPNFVTLDINTLKEVAHWYLPPSRPATPDCCQISIGDKDWLDGLNGNNDKGIILAAGLEDRTVYILKWTPRT